MARYVKIADLAKESKTNMNVKVNELLVLGLGENINIEAALARLVRRAQKQDDNDNG
jgi:hypothetical protein